MKCKLYIGQKVVHVPHWGGIYNNRKALDYLQWPDENGIYTIADLIIARKYGYEAESVGVKLLEIPRQKTKEGYEVLFDYSEFKPLSWLNIDISCFTKMLKGEPLHV